MSKFSDKLRQLLKESGIKIYQIAKSADLDRTTIQRAVTGDRLPGTAFLSKLCDYLRVSPGERQELFELYTISKIGEQAYAGRKFIKEIVEGIATINLQGRGLPGTSKNIHLEGKINEDNAVYRGQYLVNDLIRNILEDEVFNNSTPEIGLCVPFSYGFLYDLLYQLYLEKKGEIKIKNLVRLNKNPESPKHPNHNLEVLSQVIPLSFFSGKGYTPYYYYDNFDSSRDISLLMPYYIITSRRLVTLSSDFKTALLFNSGDIVDSCSEIFEVAISKSRPLITHRLNSESTLLDYIIESSKTIAEVTHILEPQPCFAWYYTDELIDCHLRKDIANRQLILEAACEIYGAHRRSKVRPMSIFSMEGLNYFVSKGIIEDLPQEYTLPFTIEERIMLLTKLRDDIISDEYRAFAADSSKLIIPLSSIQLFDTDKLEFNVINNSGFISSSSLDEQTITEAFYDFFESLPESGLIYDKDETIKIIDSFIEKLK